MTGTAVVDEGFHMTELGLIPCDWEVVKLGDVAYFETGRRMKGGALENGEVLSLGGEHITNSGNIDLCKPKFISKDFYNGLSKGKLRNDDVIICKDGARTGKVAYIKFTHGQCMAVNEHVFIVRSKDDRALYSQFIFYFLFSALGQSQVREAYHGLIGGITNSNISNFKMLLPSLSEQKRIAYVLSTVQNVVEKTGAVIKAARELKKSLMKHLFTCGPVSIAEAEKVPLKEAEIGLVPEGWEVVRLDEVITEGIRNGAFVRRSNFGNGVIFLNVADTYSNVSADLRVSERVQCTDEEFRLYEIKPGDLFYVRSSLKREGVGQCCVVEHIPEPSIYDCHLMRVRVDDERVIPKFLAYYSVSLPGKLSLISRSKTTTMTTINQRGLAYFAVPLPPIPTQREIANTLTAVDDKIQSEENKRQALEALFKTLLSRLMTGKIRVKNLEVSV